jgi:hypothetical protein
MALENASSVEGVCGGLPMVTLDRERIMAALHVDRLFNNYEIEMDPSETVSLIEVAPQAGIPSIRETAWMLEGINKLIPPIDFGPSNPQTGKSHHLYRIGRERGRRVIKLTLFTGVFPLEYDFTELLSGIHVHCRNAGAVMEARIDTSIYSIVIRWPEETEAAS